MATWDDVRQVALDLPGAVEDRSGSTTAWRVGSRAFAWERVLRRGERATFDDVDEAVTDAWLARAPKRLSGPFLAGPR